MEKLKKKIVKKLSVTITITIILFSIFSIPFGLLAPLGNVIFPSSGLWKVPSEVPEYEVLYIEGLDDEVIAYRDEWGIPHIYAETEDDLFFAIGYIHAQDRLYSMDIMRRIIRGKLSEVFGKSTLESDEFMLALGLEYWADKSLDAIKNLEKIGVIDLIDELERYVDGVNYYINTHSDELPIEYTIFDFKPKEWTLIDCLCYYKLQSLQLSFNINDFINIFCSEELGNSHFSEIFDVNLPYQIPVCPNYGSIDDSFTEINTLYRSLDLQTNFSSKNYLSNSKENVKIINTFNPIMDIDIQSALGSNNWVVNGEKSSTGKPILCNDIHLRWNMPSTWYEVHLVAEDTDLDTYGFTVPGNPIPFIGHNKYIAWGATNANYDAIDWYIYDTIDSNHYLHNGSVKEYEIKKYEISIRGGEPSKFEVDYTVHGPVLSELILFERLNSGIEHFLERDDFIYVPKWTANDISYEILAYYGFNHAKNRAEFNESSRWFTNPSQNFLYADIYGNIAVRPTGLVPIRENPENGIFPIDASVVNGKWLGYIPFEELPHTENPSQNFLVSANQPVVGPDYDEYILQQLPFDAGYRARRINQLLNNSEDGTIDVDKMKEIQLDVKSTAAQFFTPHLINVIESFQLNENNDLMDDVLKTLKKWNYEMKSDLAAPTIFRKWRELFMEYTFIDHFSYFEALPRLNILENLMRNEPDSFWFDDIGTVEIENRDSIIIKALKETIDFLEEYYDTDDVSEWKWGDIHKIYFPNFLDPKGPYEVDGELHTINPSGVNMIEDIDDEIEFGSVGASMRAIYDLNNWRNSISVIASGQREITSSKHYSDQLEDLFLKGKYHEQYYYDDPKEFPKELIESQIHFIPADKRDENFILLFIFLTILLLVSIVSLIFINRRTNLIFNKKLISNIKNVILKITNIKFLIQSYKSGEKKSILRSLKEI